MLDPTQALDALIAGFADALLEKDDYFLQNMQTKNLAGDNISHYQFWEWPQGVGLFALALLWQHTNDPAMLDFLVSFYDQRISEGLPAKNINTMAPLLALSIIAGQVPKGEFINTLREWAEWAMHDLPRTDEGGFQHITSDTVNEGELWDDTLLMAVCPLASIGVLLDEPTYVEEAIAQVRIHATYLADRKTGLWFHGYSSLEQSNFSEALWARGNCWITIALPYLMKIVDLAEADRALFKSLLVAQATALQSLQHESGMWHTLLDDPTSYLEASATCGIAYGLLKAQDIGLLDQSFRETAYRPLAKILSLIDEKGTVSQVSYGTPMGRISKDFYKEIPLVKMPYGTALALLYISEVVHATA